MTWKEFKEACEAEGVTDDMEIQYIDIGHKEAHNLHVSLPNDISEGNNWHDLMIH